MTSEQQPKRPARLSLSDRLHQAMQDIPWEEINKALENQTTYLADTFKDTKIKLITNRSKSFPSKETN